MESSSGKLLNFWTILLALSHELARSCSEAVEKEVGYNPQNCGKRASKGKRIPWDRIGSHLWMGKCHRNGKRSLSID